MQFSPEILFHIESFNEEVSDLCPRKDSILKALKQTQSDDWER